MGSFDGVQVMSAIEIRRHNKCAVTHFAPIWVNTSSSLAALRCSRLSKYHLYHASYTPVLTLTAHLSLSRLNHWLPRAQTQPEVVQGTAEFHHEITDTLLPQTNAVLHDTTALDTAVDMLDP
jgi:hypothetical protein